MTLVTVAGIAFALTAAGVVAFQVALAAGAPWGAYAMGGAFPGRYPPALRVLALVQAAVIGILALIVLSSAGIAMTGIGEQLPWLIWVVVLFSLVAVVMNAISRSAGERRIWVPVSIVLLLTSLSVALA